MDQEPNERFTLASGVAQTGHLSAEGHLVNEGDSQNARDSQRNNSEDGEAGVA